MPVTTRRRVPVRFSYQPIVRRQSLWSSPVCGKRTVDQVWCEDCLDKLRTSRATWGIHWQYAPLDAGLVTCPQCRKPFTGEIAGAKYLARETA